MNDDLNLKYGKKNIELRRATVLDLLLKGHKQIEISDKLGVSSALISLDIQYIRERSKKELESHITNRLPFEYTRALEGMNNVLKKVSDIEDRATDTRTKLECSKLKMELYRSIMSLATDGSVIERALKMIKVISPLPGEDIPAKSQEDKEQQQQDDVSTEETETETETEPEDITEEE